MVVGAETVCVVAIEMGEITAGDVVDEISDFEVVVVVVFDAVVSVGVVLVVVGIVVVVVVDLVVVIDVVVVDVVVVIGIVVVIGTVDSDGVVVAGFSVVEIVELDSIDLEQTVLGRLFHSQPSSSKMLKMPLK